MKKTLLTSTRVAASVTALFTADSLRAKPSELVSIGLFDQDSEDSRDMESHSIKIFECCIRGALRAGVTDMGIGEFAAIS